MIKMMHILKLTAILLFFTAAAPALLYAKNAEPPSSCPIYAYFDVNGQDPGMKWFVQNWFDGVLKSGIDENQKKNMNSLYQKLFPFRLSVDLLRQNGSAYDYAVVLDFMTRPEDQQLYILNTFKQLLYGGAQSVSQKAYKNYNYWFNPANTKTDVLNVCGRIDSNLVITNEKKNFLKIVDDNKDRTKVLTASPQYGKMVKLAKKADGIIYFNNAGRQFTGVLKEFEKKSGITLLLSIDVIRAVIVSLDIVDEKTARGEFIFDCSDESFIEDVVDDAEFLWEAISRKINSPELKITRKVTKDRNTVRLNFTITGIKQLGKIF